MAIKDKSDRNKAHTFENIPPHQERYTRGDDDWNLKTTACPLTSPKVSSHPNDSRALEHERTVGFPISNEKDSRYIFRSTTDGKGRK